MRQSSVVRSAGQTWWTVWTWWTWWTGQEHPPAPHDSQNNHNRDGCATFLTACHPVRLSNNPIKNLVSFRVVRC